MSFSGSAMLIYLIRAYGLYKTGSMIVQLLGMILLPIGNVSLYGSIYTTLAVSVERFLGKNSYQNLCMYLVHCIFELRQWKLCIHSNVLYKQGPFWMGIGEKYFSCGFSTLNSKTFMCLTSKSSLTYYSWNFISCRCELPNGIKDKTTSQFLRLSPSSFAIGNRF